MHWQLLAVPGSFPDTSEGSSPNAGMVLADKAIGSYWQLMAVLVSTLLPATIIGRYWQLKFLSVTWQLQMHLSYWVLGSYNYWHIDTVGSTWQLLIHHSTVNFFISEEDSCFKGCISRNAVKSSVILEATRQFISGLPPGVTFDGVFHNTISSTHIKVFFESSLHQR